MNINDLLVELGQEVKLNEMQDLTKTRQLSISEAIEEISSKKVISILGEMRREIIELRKEVEELKNHKCGCHG